MSTAAQALSAYVLKDLVRRLNPAKFPTIADLGYAHWFCARGEVLPSLRLRGRVDRRRGHARSGKWRHARRTSAWQPLQCFAEVCPSSLTRA